MENRVAVVIPFYHKILSELENISFSQCIKILEKYPIILLIPNGLNVDEYLIRQNIFIQEVDSIILESKEAYNRFMLSKEFYSLFIKYEFILIYQLDAFVFSDRLIEFCQLNYDYIGAPWLEGLYYPASLERCLWYVGNGGFSLRKVSSILYILNQSKELSISVNEDVFFSSRQSDKFRIAPISVAVDFAFEASVEECFALNNYKLPFGCHAWEKHNWEFFKPLFKQYGYDINTILSGDLDKSIYENQYKHLQSSKTDIKQALKKLLRYTKKEVLVYGAGNWGEECGWLLLNAGVSIVSYIDLDKEKHGKTLWDIPIISMDQIKVFRYSIPIIIAVRNNYKEIIENLETHGYVYQRDIILYEQLKDALIRRNRYEKF